MANTYTYINSSSLTVNTASVTFSSIPATYDDLMLHVSTRSDRSGAAFDVLALRFNGSSGTDYSYTLLRGDGSSTASFAWSNTNNLLRVSYSDASTATSNTFASAEIYIPFYTGSDIKQIGAFGASESNSTTSADANLTAYGSLWSLTNAITSITILPVIGSNWIAGSTFYLYGIKNS